MSVSKTLTQYDPNKYFKFSRTSWFFNAEEKKKQLSSSIQPKIFRGVMCAFLAPINNYHIKRTQTVWELWCPWGLWPA